MKQFIAIIIYLITDSGSFTAQSVQIPEIMSEDREMAMALSAAPDHLRAEAGVYVLRKSGFVRARDSRNGFTCIVNRDHPRALKPTCWDAEGTATIVPKVLRVGELLMQRRSLAEIDRDIAEGFRTGRFRPPSTSSYPPHVMIYAPHLTNTDIGMTPEAGAANPRLPFIAYQGPHGYFIVPAAPHALPPERRTRSGRSRVMCISSWTTTARTKCQGACAGSRVTRGRLM